MKSVMDLPMILNLQEKVKGIQTCENILNYITRIVFATRENKEEIKLGASPRASIALMKASCAWALLGGRDYVVPEDVVKMSPWILKHRLILQPKALVSGRNVDSVLAEIIRKTPIS